MHGTARAPGYPSDSTRSLAGVGPQDDWRAAARTTTSRPQRGMRAATLTPGAPRAGRAGGRRGLPDRCHPRPPRCRPRLAPPSALPSTVRTGAARQDSPTPPRFLIRHHPRPPCGRGWCRSAGKSRVRGGTPRDLSLSLTLAGVGQCSLADGHGRQTGRPRSSGSSARIATGGPGTLSGGGSSRCCRWRIAVGAVYPRGREAVQPGPLVRRQLGGLSEPDRQRRAAASAAGTLGRAQPISYRMHPRGWPEDGNSTVLPGPVAGRAGQHLRTGCAPACGMPRCSPSGAASGLMTRPVAR